MRKSILLNPSSFSVQSSAHNSIVFDQLLGEGTYNVVFHSLDKNFVGKFQKTKDKTDNPERLVRVFEDLYEENLEAQVVTYQGDDIVIQDGVDNHVYKLAQSGKNMLLMRYCKGSQPSDEEIALAVLDLVLTRHRLVVDGHIKGNFIKLTEAVGNLSVEKVVCIDVGNALKLGRESSLSHWYSQDSLDEWGYEHDGLRCEYRNHFNALACNKNLVTQSLIKAVIFLEENFPQFHNLLWQLKDQRAWWPILEKAYHLFPYGAGFSTEMQNAATLDQTFIDALAAVNDNHYRHLTTAFKLHRIHLPGDHQKRLLMVSALGYCYDQLHRFALATPDNMQKLCNSHYRESLERVFQHFLPFDLLTQASVGLIISNPQDVLFVCHQIQGSGFAWNMATATLVLSHFENLSFVMSKLSTMKLLDHHLSAILQSEASLAAYRDIIYVLDSGQLLSQSTFQKVLLDPLSFCQCIAVLKSVGLFFPGILSKVLENTRASWLSLQVLKEFELVERAHVSRVVASDEFLQYVNQLASMALKTKDNVVRLLCAQSTKTEMVLILIQAGLCKVLSDDHQFAEFNEVKKFASRSLLVESQLPAVDLQKLWMTVMRVLSHSKGSASVVLWSAPVVYDVNQLGLAAAYFDKARDLLEVSGDQWQQDAKIPGLDCYESACVMARKTEQRLAVGL